MATEEQSSESTTESTETVAQETATEQAATSAETAETNAESATATEQQTEGETAADKDKSFNKESLLADLHKERGERKALQAQVEQLTSQLATAQKAPEQLTALSRKYDRLEAFLTAIGGPVGKALDSKSFTEKLFNTDTDVQELATEWNRDNPTATSQALAGAATATGGKPDMNDLLRQAVK